MQTYTHFVMTAVYNRYRKNQTRDESTSTTSDASFWAKLPPLRSGPLLLGSVMPDVPLIAIFVVMFAIDMSNGVRLDPGDPDIENISLVGRLFRDWFFNSPWLKAAHNIFHGPIMTLSYVLIGYWAWRSNRKWGPALFWFGAACTLHTFIDIPVHYDDGPLLFFPFDWETRFYSPISYWDNSRYGFAFTIFEHSLLLVMLVWLAWDWWRRRRNHSVRSTDAVDTVR